MLKPKSKTLKGTRANVGLEAAYRKRLLGWVELLHKSVMYWLSSAYNQNEPIMAQDAVPAAELQKAIRKLSRRWKKNFNEASPELAKWFGTSVWKRSDRDLERILKEGGFAVEFKLTKAQRDVLHATINQNVSLIKSIPTQYLQKVEGMVMRSVQVGGDLATLTKQIQKEFRLTKKHAKLIAHDQNNKAQASLVRARQMELGVKKAIWVHSHAGKHPRPTHLRNDGKQYDVNKGWYDPAVKRFIHPGTEINCRCFSRSIIEGFS